ncbi:MAG: LysM peptidoglycan-binding domain-containing protein [Rubripirellula sp.]|nr:LysM peptidoglycan-binding domain-containing protein [Rubripirellula sp.]
MQTVKTAAIVVLLMTGLYGTYVSLTTPPEPLPEEVQAILDFDPELDFAIDSGLPESLEAFDLAEDSASRGTSPSDQTDPLSGTADAAMATTEPSPTSGSAPANDLANQPNAISSSASQAAKTVGLSGAQADRATAPELALTSGTVADSGAFMTPEMVQRAGLATENMTPNLGLNNAIETADRQFMSDKLRDALGTLSIFYNAPNITGEQRSQLLARLDPLAREVIYSKRHLLEQPHRVGQDETLTEIASIYQVPWQLLANINHISDPVTILPGTELKVVRGPFRAEVHLEMKEITLFLGDLYAGRFPVEVGSDPTPVLGTYTIQEKQTKRTYYDREGSPVPPGSPANPYGDVWMDLGGMLSIHGSPNPTAPTNQGCISLASNAAKDVFGILSQGSSVTIRR